MTLMAHFDTRAKIELRSAYIPLVCAVGPEITADLFVLPSGLVRDYFSRILLLIAARLDTSTIATMAAPALIDSVGHATILLVQPPILFDQISRLLGNGIDTTLNITPRNHGEDACIYNT